MNDQNQQHDELEMYLDGMLSESDRDTFLKHYDPEKLKQAQATQNKIDASLRSMFQYDPMDSVQVQEVTRKAFQSDSSVSAVDKAKPSPAVKLKGTESVNSGRRFALIALAASMLAIIGGGLYLMNNEGLTDPFVPNRSVASLYQETVQAGFHPYYNCEDLERFATTFEFRLGTPVHLAESEMPEGTRMLGLSYLGGTSRQSTAMLGEVDGHQVIVFVDRDSATQPDVSTDGTDGLNVFVVKRDGLVFAEVSPLEEAKLIQYLKVLDE